jgi:hypothetical protein
MSHLISKSLLALSIALAVPAMCAAPAAVAAEAKKPVKAKAKSKAKAQKSSDDSGAPVASTPEAEPDITDNKVVQFNCELGNVVTIYNHEVDKDSIALRWKKRLHRLTRVGTTTGANRFENRNFGLVWIGIPSKGMLLDSKQNRQLANECKNAEQENPSMVAEAPKTAPTPLIAPIGGQVVTPIVPRPQQVQPLIVPPQGLPAPAPQSDQPTQVQPLISAPTGNR